MSKKWYYNDEGLPTHDGLCIFWSTRLVGQPPPCDCGLSEQAMSWSETATDTSTGVKCPTEPTTSGGSTPSLNQTSPGIKPGDRFNAAEFYQREQRAALAQGVNPKEKYGATKPDLSVVPPASVIHEALAMMDGARKYGPYNWRTSKKVLAMTYVAAALRHIAAWVDGEEIAEDSKRHHLGHAKACLGILLDAMENNNLEDNRPAQGPASSIIKRETTKIEGAK